MSDERAIAVASEQVTVFISYAHEDDPARQELRKHLRAIRNDNRDRMLHLNDDRQIPAGGKWDDEIKTAMAAADIVLFLVSSDFLDSDYVETEEIPAALQMHDAGRKEVIPILLRACPWRNTRLAEFNCIPADEKYLMGGAGERFDDAAFLAVAESIKKVAETILLNRAAEQERRTEKRETYRKKVASMLSDGVISRGEQDTLDELQKDLHLTDDEAHEIREGEIQPFKAKEENKLRYRKTLDGHLADGGHPFSAAVRKDLLDRQRDLGLTDEDLEGLEESAVEDWTLANTAVQPEVPPEPSTTAGIGDAAVDPGPVGDDFGEDEQAESATGEGLAPFVDDQILIVRDRPFGQEDLAGCAYVTEVGSGSPASRLGVAPGDLLIEFDGRPGSSLGERFDESEWAPTHLEFRTVARGYLTVETTGIDPGFDVGLTPEAAKARPGAFNDPDVYFTLWEHGDNEGILGLCRLAALASNVPADLADDEFSVALDRAVEDYAEEYDAFEGDMSVSRRFGPATFHGLYMGAAMWALGDPRGLWLVDRFESEAGDYTLDHHAVMYCTQGLVASSEGDRMLAARLFEQANSIMRGESQRVNAELKRIGTTPPDQSTGLLGLPFPVTYELAELHGRHRHDLWGVLDGLAPHQLHLVCLLYPYRSNGPYHAQMLVYDNFATYMPEFFPSLHVITENPDDQPHSDAQEYWLRGEQSAIAAGHDVTVLFDPDGIFGSVGSDSSPHFLAIDSDGVVKGDFRGGFSSAAIWTALDRHVRSLGW